jgi:hypothetical protein
MQPSPSNQPTPPHRSAPHPRRADRFPLAVRIPVYILLVLVLLVVLLRVVLSPLAVWYTNKKMAEVPGYSGKVKDIDFDFLNGHYSIEGTRIVLTDRPRPASVFHAPDVEVHLLWGPLFKGRVVGAVDVDRPTINLYQRMITEKEKGKAEKPKKKTPPPGVVFRRTIPVRVDEFNIDNGEVHFKNYLEKPYFDLYLTDVELKVRNLTNRRKAQSPNYATADLSALAMGSGKVSMHVTVNPITRLPTFYVAFKMIGLDVKAMNTFTREVGGFDFEKGRFDMVTEITVDHGKITGYVKPLFKDLQVFSWDKDLQQRGGSVSQAFWEGIVGAVGEVLENQPKDQLATRIPLSGTITDPDISVEEAIINVLRNAFQRAFLPTLEHSVKPPRD